MTLCACGCGETVRSSGCKWRPGHSARRNDGPERFMSRLDTSGGPDSCWEYQGTIDHTGYGRISVENRYLSTHRYAAQLWIGDPTGYVVRHTCDNRPCCNPAHLLLGTMLDNVRDRVERGRSRTLRGDECSYSKLTEAQVIDIKRALARGVTARSLAREYEVNRTTISAIKNGVNWAWLKLPEEVAA